MTSFAADATFLFLALRAGDILNLAAGLWIVPKFISSENLGAVLPVTTFATLLALPMFAFGMAVMKTSTDLAGQGKYGQLRSLLHRVFIITAILTVISLALASILLPQYLDRMQLVNESPSDLTAFLAVSAALLGAVAPMYTDALQALKRFRTLGAIEFAAIGARVATLIILMPFRAFAGYFTGNAMQPLVRIAGSVISLRGVLTHESQYHLTRQNTKTLFARFVVILFYLAIPMGVSCMETDLIRHGLPLQESAGYFITSRMSDILNYLTFPLLIVLFPYAAERERNGKSSFPLVVKCSAATIVAAISLGTIYALWGSKIITVIPNGERYVTQLGNLPTMLSISALIACQTFFTNAEVAAGRFAFLWWLTPISIIYAIVLKMASPNSLCEMLNLFLAGAIVRAILSTAHLIWMEIRVDR